MSVFRQCLLLHGLVYVLACQSYFMVCHFWLCLITLGRLQLFSTLRLEVCPLDQFVGEVLLDESSVVQVDLREGCPSFARPVNPCVTI